MNRLIFIILLFLPFYSFSKEKAISDGPYIFIEKNKLVEKNIINNKVFSKVLESDSFNTAFIPFPLVVNVTAEVVVFDVQLGLLPTLLKPPFSVRLPPANTSTSVTYNDAPAALPPE